MLLYKQGQTQRVYDIHGPMHTHGDKRVHNEFVGPTLYYRVIFILTGSISLM